MTDLGIELLPLSEIDLELVRNWRNSPSVSQYMYTNEYISPEQQQNWFKKVSSDDSQKYWIVLFQGKKVGLVSIYSINQRFKWCHWGFYLGEEQERGQKIGSKVECFFLEYLFNTLHFNRVIGEVFALNSKGVAFHEKFGFRREGYFRQHILKDGIYHDVVAIALLKNEWNLLREHNFKWAFSTSSSESDLNTET